MLEGDRSAAWLFLPIRLIWVGIWSDASQISKERTKARLGCTKYATESLNLEPLCSLSKIRRGNDALEIV